MRFTWTKVLSRENDDDNNPEKQQRHTEQMRDGWLLDGSIGNSCHIVDMLFALRVLLSGILVRLFDHKRLSDARTSAQMQRKYSV